MSCSFATPSLPDSIGQLRSKHESLEQFVEQLFDDLARQDRQAADREAAQREQISQCESERQNVERECRQLRDELARLENLSTELASLRAETQRLREQLAAETQAVQQLRFALAEAQIERRAATSELESARRRAAELAEDLAANKRQTTEERAAWNAELKQWRRLFEKQSMLLTVQQSAQHPPRPETRKAETSDPVLDSILSDLEPIWRDGISGTSSFD